MKYSGEHPTKCAGIVHWLLQNVKGIKKLDKWRGVSCKIQIYKIPRKKA